MSHKHWTAEEIQFVKKNVNKLNNIELGKALGRSKLSISMMMLNYRIERSKKAIKKFITENGRRSGFKRGKKAEFKFIPCKLYPELGNCLVSISHRVGNHGYPQISRNGKQVLMKNYLWEKKYGKVPKGMCVLHKCDNRACVRLEHLFLGTQADNMYDAIEKGRVPQLTEREVKYGFNC